MKEFITRNECVNKETNLTKKMDDIKQQIEDIKIQLAKLPDCLIKRLDEKYVSKDAFKPVRLVAYGLVGTMVAVILMLLDILFRK